MCHQAPMRYKGRSLLRHARGWEGQRIAPMRSVWYLGWSRRAEAKQKPYVGKGKTPSYKQQRLKSPKLPSYVSVKHRTPQ